MNNLFWWVKLKFIVAPLVAIVVILTVSYTFSYHYVKAVVIERMSQDAKGTAVAIAHLVEADLDNYTQFMTERISGTAYYKKMMALFDDIKAENNTIKYIYTTHAFDGNRTEFVVSDDYIDIPDGEKLEFVEEFGNEITLKVLNTGVAQILPPTDSVNYGVMIGGNAPIRDNDGNVISAIGVDVDIQTVYETLHGFLILLIVVGLVIVLFSAIVLLKTSDKLAHDILKDKLTGAYNKKYTEKILRHGLKRAQAGKQGYTVLMLDLDHFKNVNDSYGHPFGDTVLTIVGKVILDNIRSEDAFIRYGGEEFIVTLADADAERGKVLAERIRKSIENRQVFDRERNLQVPITISIGGVSVNWQEEVEPSRLIEQSDVALYKAKETRNAVAWS
ncbi:MAG: diguanylate cyclase [Deferribacteraceae bacterium]|nr:diguanylate cyclase [Deferribacteraceae bacterium]